MWLVGVHLKWQDYRLDPQVTVRYSSEREHGWRECTGSGLRKEKKNRVHGVNGYLLLPWGFQARGGGKDDGSVAALTSDVRFWGHLHVVPSPLRHVVRYTPSGPGIIPSHPPTLFSMPDSFRQSLTGSVLSHRVFLYTFASTLAVSATVINALQNHSNFYSVAVYLSKSGASVLVTSSSLSSLRRRPDDPPSPRSSPTSASCCP